MAANNRNTTRNYGGASGSGSGGGNRIDITYVDHINQATHVIRRFDFDNYYEYNRDASRVWSTLETLRANARTTRNSGPANFMLMMEMSALSNRDILLTERSRLNDVIRQLIYDSGDLSQFNTIYDQNSDAPVSFSVVQVRPRTRSSRPSYRASGRVWGYIGDKLLNCVTKNMMEFVTYYKFDGSKRDYMWNPITGAKYPTSPGEEGYEQRVMNKLAGDKAYKAIKKGILQYMDKRGVKPYEDFGFQPRDLCELAELCGCRIVVWIDSGGSYRVCRHDTDDLVNFTGTRDQRYVFNFYMMSDQHLELMDPACIDASDSVSGICRRLFPGKSPVLEYLSDEDFESILKDEGAKPQEERRLYTVSKDIMEPTKLARGFPKETLGYKYSGWILTSGDRVFKHESFKDWTELIVEKDEIPEVDAAMMTSLSDVHAYKLMKVYADNNIKPIRQRSFPRLYNAVKWADMQFGHVQLQMESGSDMYEYDGRKWYGTDFSTMSEEEFPYFHGIPYSDSWSEYEGVSKSFVQTRGGFESRTSMIGNGPGDRPFTFKYGTKYAIFQVESLDLSGVDDNIRAHLERDKMFVDFVPETSVMMLPSPIVHFLQDLGAIWRASRVWVCYGCGEHWVPKDAKGKKLMREMVKNKTYPVVVGKLMCGRNPIQSITYIAPDPETALSLQYFYSLQFAHGRLANEQRTDPEIIFEGEEHEYESIEDVREDIDPDDIIYSDSGDFIGAAEPNYAVVKNGGYIIPTVKKDEWDGKCPFFVETFQSTHNWASTFSHISGAQHAMCFVRLYQAVIKLECSDVIGFSLDALRTSRDVSDLLAPLMGDAPGYFKPVEIKPYKCPFHRSGSMLSDLYTPRKQFIGVNIPEEGYPLWNAYKDSLGQFNIVTGKAGSGKTTRHFKVYGYGENDYRLSPNSVYMTMTNHLAHHMKLDLGVDSHTSFKGFNRRVNDEGSYIEASKRYNYAANMKAGKIREGNKIDKLDCKHTVMLDEVSMIDPGKILDIIDVCKHHYVQLLIVGDLDRDRFYQLSPVGHTQEAFFKAIEKGETKHNIKFNWVAPMEVFRQVDDPGLKELLDKLRELDSVDAWEYLYKSPVVRHITYDEMLEEFRPEKDLVAQPWHRLIGQVTHDVLERMGPDDVLKIRGNFSSPRKIDGEHSNILSRLKMCEDDDIVYKGSVGKITKRELGDLCDSKLMSNGFPYAGSSGNANEVNPMIGATVFNLQGLTLDNDATIYIHTDTDGCMEWNDDNQPKLAYVAASRARRRDQIVIVSGPNAKLSSGTKKHKRRRFS